jgi:hypothetical protein
LVFHFQLSLFTKTKPSMIVLYSQVKSLFIWVIKSLISFQPGWQDNSMKEK